jgi:hypothetical protein
VVDPWIGVKPNQEKDFSPTSVGLLRTYINEIETSDIVVLLLGNRYGPDVPEEGAGVEAARRPWLQAHVEKSGRFGSMLDLIVARVLDLSLIDKVSLGLGVWEVRGFWIGWMIELGGFRNLTGRCTWLTTLHKWIHICTINWSKLEIADTRDRPAERARL